MEFLLVVNNAMLRFRNYIWNKPEKYGTSWHILRHNDADKFPDVHRGVRDRHFLLSRSCRGASTTHVHLQRGVRLGWRRTDYLRRRPQDTPR